MNEISFQPSRCSVCGGAVAVQLLVLWLKLFMRHPSEVSIDREFLSLLWQDSPINKALSESKRKVLREIATRSREGARLVLQELRKRLSTGDDIVSAEILGSILQVEGFCMAEEYSQLAIDVLGCSSSNLGGV